MTAVLVIVIVALAIALGLAHRDRNQNDVSGVTSELKDIKVDEEPTSARLTPESPLYVKPTYLKEKRFHYGAVAADSKICSFYGK